MCFSADSPRRFCCTSVVSYVAFVLSLCFFSSVFSMLRDGGAPGLRDFLGIIGISA